MGADDLQLLEHGAQRYAGVFTGALSETEHALADISDGRAGVRLQGLPGLLRALAWTGALGRIATGILGADYRPVRALLFDKSEASNWSLSWHQDRTIAVARRVNVEGFGPWTIKAGMHHVEPPEDLHRKMYTLRLHLDAVPATNAPLLVAPGSHCLGRIPQTDIASVVRRCGSVACAAEAGDAWAYSTPILHASEPAVKATRRRVLQVDYAIGELPGGLNWLGI